VPLVPDPLVPIDPLVLVSPVVPLVPDAPVPAAPLAPEAPLVPDEPLVLELLWSDFFCFFCFCFWLELVVPLLELPEVWSLACEPDWPAVLLDCALALNDMVMAAATDAPSIAFNSLCIFMSIS
jgi:hypothetical protein